MEKYQRNRWQLAGGLPYLIVNEAHLRRVLATYVKHYNHARPHQGLGQQTPVPSDRQCGTGPVRCRDVLGGLVHEYDREAA